MPLFPALVGQGYASPSCTNSAADECSAKGMNIADSVGAAGAAVRVACHVRGGVKCYYANICIDSLVFRCRSRPHLTEAQCQQNYLSQIKDKVARAAGAFETRVRDAVAEVTRAAKLKGESDWGLSVSVRVSASWWLGQDLLSPGRCLDELDTALEDWRQLRVARGHVKVGGKGALYHQSLQDLESTWTRLRDTYLTICAEKGANLRALAAQLDEKVAARAGHRQVQLERYRGFRCKRLELQQRRDARRVGQELRRKMRLERTEVKDRSKASVREAKSLHALEPLLARWCP